MTFKLFMSDLGEGRVGGHRRAQARQLCEEAESGWQKAKEEFEKKLLG